MQWFYLDANQQQVPADESELGTLLQSGLITADTLLWNETMTDWQPGQELFPDWFPAAAEDAPQASGPMLRAPALSSRRSATVGLVKRPIQTSGSGGNKPAAVGSATTGIRKSTPTAAGRATTRLSSREEADVEVSPDTVKYFARFLETHSGWMKFVGVLMIVLGALNCLSLVGALIGWLPIWQGIVLNKAVNAVRLAAYKGNRADLEEALERTGFYFKMTGIVLLSVLVFYAVIIVVFFTFFFSAMAVAGSAMKNMPPGGVPAGFPVEMNPAAPGVPPAPVQIPGVTPPEAPVTAPAPAPATPPAPPAAAPAPATPAPATPAPAAPAPPPVK